MNPSDQCGTVSSGQPGWVPRGAPHQSRLSFLSTPCARRCRLNTCALHNGPLDRPAIVVPPLYKGMSVQSPSWVSEPQGARLPQQPAAGGSVQLCDSRLDPTKHLSTQGLPSAHGDHPASASQGLGLLVSSHTARVWFFVFCFLILFALSQSLKFSNFIEYY